MPDGDTDLSVPKEHDDDDSSSLLDLDNDFTNSHSLDFVHIDKKPQSVARKTPQLDNSKCDSPY